MCAASQRGSRCWRKTLARYGEAGPKRALCVEAGTKRQVISRTDSQARARSRRLRGPVLDRPAPARPDDLHRFCLPATPALEGCGAGGKRWTATGRHRSPRCLRSDAPSAPSCSLHLRSLIVARTAIDDFLTTLQKCQGRARGYAYSVAACWSFSVTVIMVVAVAL